MAAQVGGLVSRRLVSGRLAVGVPALVLAVTLALGLGFAGVAGAQTPTPNPPVGNTTVTPVYGPPPGVRSPAQGWVAGFAILVVAGAGIFIYRIIRHGL